MFGVNKTHFRTILYECPLVRHFIYQRPLQADILAEATVNEENYIPTKKLSNININ